MKRLLCALIALMLLGSFACAETLRVGMECNYAPYNWTQTEASDEALPLSGGGYADGYDVRIAKRVAEELAATSRSSRPSGTGWCPRCSPATST